MTELGAFDQETWSLLFAQAGLVEAEEVAALMQRLEVLSGIQSPLFCIGRDNYKCCIFSRVLLLWMTSFESKSSAESIESFRSSSESEFVPLGPPFYVFQFKFESFVLGKP